MNTKTTSGILVHGICPLEDGKVMGMVGSIPVIFDDSGRGWYTSPFDLDLDDICEQFNKLGKYNVGVTYVNRVPTLMSYKDGIQKQTTITEILYES